MAEFLSRDGEVQLPIVELIEHRFDELDIPSVVFAASTKSAMYWDIYRKSSRDRCNPH